MGLGGEHSLTEQHLLERAETDALRRAMGVLALLVPARLLAILAFGHDLLFLRL
jgi:hypothetical protein